MELTVEQQMLAESVTSLLEKNYAPNSRLNLLEHDKLGWSREMWKHYAALGLLGLTFDEEYGGAGMGADELAVVMEAFGRALILEPFFATVVLGGALVAAAGTPDQKQQILPKVADGDLLLAFAWSEASSRWSRAAVNTVATRTGGIWTVSGAKSNVLGGDVAQELIVTAKTSEGHTGLFLVAGGAVSRRALKMHDGLGGADIALQDAPARALGDPSTAAAKIDAVLDGAIVALCAEAVGAMEKMLWLTVDYLKTRVQFGQPISNFQALQFRAADMYVAYEQAKSMAMLARIVLVNDDVTERRRLIQAAKAQVDISARHVGQEAVQLHGGIGMTAEYSVGHYFKRTAVIARTFADENTLLKLIATGGGLIKPE